MKGEVLELASRWVIGDQIGKGGYGRVHELEGGAEAAVAKFVPKEPGADRELLFVNLSDKRNVVPVIDSGEFRDSWVLVMPRAEMSLRDLLEARVTALPPNECVPILIDIVTALADLDGHVVHRDLKPENVLLLAGTWCLADFGISRYAEASTAPDTHKWSMTAAYAAPERWRSERATSATDVYALGVIAFELMSGRRPFAGPKSEDYREQHLHEDAPPLDGVVVPLAALVDECLFKSASTRPTAANLLARLSKRRSTASSDAMAALVAANRAEVQRLAASGTRASVAASEAERRAERRRAARVTLGRISAALREALVEAAPAAELASLGEKGWSLKLGRATLTVAGGLERDSRWGDWEPPAFAVDSTSSINLKIPATSHGYEGRSHSLWFGDIQSEGSFGWYETGFMFTPLARKQSRQAPFALDPDTAAAKAVWGGLAEYQVAWPFTRLEVEELSEFTERWMGWFAAAATGRLGHPSTMPERSTQGSWRR